MNIEYSMPVWTFLRYTCCISCDCWQVNATAMPSGNGAEHQIHAHIGEIKKRDERIVVKFEGILPYFGSI